MEQRRPGRWCSTAPLSIRLRAGSRTMSGGWGRPRFWMWAMRKRKSSPWPTVSFHLGRGVSTIDLRGPELSEEILEGAERAANQVIFEDRPVSVRYGTAEDLAQLGVRKKVERSGILRAIEIEGADLQPCGGTHVKRTAQMGVILVRQCTKIRQDWRVEFVCGRRAERAARQDFLLLRRVAERLGCATSEVVEASERVLTDRDAHFKP